MIFQPEHREQIRTGEKTVTRRRWSICRVTPGKTYRATLGGNVEQGMFTPRSECDCFIRVTGVSREPLGSMDSFDAQLEGGYSLAGFRDLWRDINGGWDPDERIWAIEFEHAGDSDPERGGR